MNIPEISRPSRIQLIRLSIRQRVIVLSLFAAASYTRHSSAGQFSFDSNGALPGQVTSNVISFDWAVNSALAKGGMTAIRNFIINDGPTSFYTYSQGYLSNLTLSGGGSTPVPGAGEITFVAKVPESVSFVSGPVIGFGSGVGPGFFEIYYDPSPNSNSLSGLGYNDGTLILRADISSAASTFLMTNTAPSLLDNAGSDDYGGLKTVTGQGSTLLEGSVTYANADFFTSFGSGTILTMFTANQLTPFSEVDPAARFAEAANGGLGSGPAPVFDGAGLGIPSLGTVNGQILAGGGETLGPDFQFQVDGSQSFVPEPGSLVPMGLGLVAFLTISWRRRRAS